MVMTYADRVKNVTDRQRSPDRRSWTDLLSSRSGGQSAKLSDRDQVVVRLKNKGNNCFVNGVVNLLFSCPPVLHLLSTSGEHLQPGSRGDVLRELQTLASLTTRQV